MELWIKSLHVMAVIAWMAGLFYLSRLFVYHTKAAAGSELSETFKIMEGKLLRVIMNPAMIVAWIAGIWLAYAQNQYMDGWFHVKFALVSFMTVYHHYLVRWMKAFARDENAHSERYYRIANEVPTLLMVGIVVMVIVKPF